MNRKFTTQRTIHARWGAALAVAALSVLPVLSGAQGAHAATHATTQPGQVVAASAATEASETHRQTATVYSVPYSDDLTLVTNGTVKTLMFKEWAALGYPKPVPAATEYVRYPWSNTVIAGTIFPGVNAKFWATLNPTTLARAGNPMPKIVKWIPGTIITKYATSDELFASFEDDYDQMGTSAHKLTFAEWAAMGYPKPQYVSDSIIKFPWLDTVFYVPAGAKASAVTFEDWAKLGYPTPLTTKTVGAYDWTFAANGVDIIFTYHDADYKKIVTPAEWAKAGYPMPSRR